MTAHLEPCGLCQEINKTLQCSHLFPASAYKQLRDPTAETDLNPVSVTRDKASTTSKQVSSYFLCHECEQRFSDLGERYVLAQCLRQNGQFKLRDLLEAATPIGAFKMPTGAGEVRVYDAQLLLGRDVAQYEYFAASIFWRASAHSWEMWGKPIRRISLGTNYQEEFRQYLLGATQFPQNARIYVIVASEHGDPTVQTIIGPCTERMDRTHRHKFWLGGICFVLFLGSDATKPFDTGALNGNGQQRIWLAPLRNDSLFTGALKLITATRPSGKLQK